ncbi:unnamed protein product [Bursaphelenchus xylophilus]|uniref:(pine wood nematode) hypothetical protein n=1 Tax=Bursaphelenchus xylophilus TaxID=6326 RepID=A0A1I7RMN5_BURXY|nr:unnamed protein product [Bursaphelenchus xylophilus]CAG9125641.1 unnamed protein product [Bursaphelenchus xylophilus]
MNNLLLGCLCLTALNVHGFDITEEYFGTVHDGVLTNTNYQPAEFDRHPQRNGEKIIGFPAFYDEPDYSYFGQAFPEQGKWCGIFNVKNGPYETCDGFRVLVNVPGNEFNLRNPDNMKPDDEKVYFRGVALVLVRDPNASGDTIFGTYVEEPQVLQYVAYNGQAEQYSGDDASTGDRILLVVKSVTAK